ncbi:hypothetical protein K438DRAFT_1983742 [Mycena galopus ATCC 62051]|nr:hypothetical protein K438DRAFT_1983742 [Mycena galopus ATCC 62051]
MSSHLTPTNLRPEELCMDERGIKDSRYYCLPPFRGDRQRAARRTGGKYVFHLVTQGHYVGIFDNWPEAKASLTGYRDNSNQGCQTEEECIEVWQRLCLLGVHPHPVDPAVLGFAPAALPEPMVNASPRRSSQSRGAKTAMSPVKKEDAGPSARRGSETLSLASSSSRDDAPINYAIRGGGIISSNA